MPDFNQNYNINFIYLVLVIGLYNIWKSNYDYINIILNNIYLLNHTSIIIIINIIGICLFLKNVSFEINIKCSLKYK
jgi:hypothetical protein